MPRALVIAALALAFSMLSPSPSDSKFGRRDAATLICAKTLLPGQSGMSFKPGTTIKLRKRGCRSYEVPIGTVGEFAEIGVNTLQIDANALSAAANAEEIAEDFLAIEENRETIGAHETEIADHAASLLHLEELAIPLPFPTYNEGYDERWTDSFVTDCESKGASDQCFDLYNSAATVFQGPLCQDAYTCDPSTNTIEPNCSERKSICDEDIQNYVYQVADGRNYQNEEITKDVVSIVLTVLGILAAIFF